MASTTSSTMDMTVKVLRAMSMYPPNWPTMRTMTRAWSLMPRVLGDVRVSKSVKVVLGKGNLAKPTFVQV